MTAVISREEADKIGSDFEKIASREEKKPSGSNVKLVLAVVTVLIVILLILIYFYVKGGGALLSKLSKTSSQANLQDALVANQGPQMPQTLFGGEPIDISGGRQLE